MSAAAFRLAVAVSRNVSISLGCFLLCANNAAPEWQAKTPKQSRKSVVACPLEGLVRLILKGGEYQCLPTYR